MEPLIEFGYFMAGCVLLLCSSFVYDVVSAHRRASKRERRAREARERILARLLK